jgi:DNA-binding MarR family transcriptional regulator
MKLEKEIKQRKFKSEYQKLSVNIIYTANWISNHYGCYCRQYGITPEQFNILRILRGQHPKPATVNLLIDRMLNKMSNASRLVEKLRQKGLVERQINLADRRACDVVITDKGLDLLKGLDKAEKEWQKIISHIPLGEAKSINDLLDKLRK